MAAMEKATEFVVKATDADNAENYVEALHFYQLAINYFVYSLKYEIKGAQAVKLRAKCGLYLMRAERIEKLLKSKGYIPVNSAMKPKSGGNGGASKGRNFCDGASPLLQEARSFMAGGAVGVEELNVHWNDIAGLDAAKAALKETIIFPVRYPHLFTGKRKPYRSALLYGPPGTGKYYVTKAVATEAEFPLFTISCANLAKCSITMAKQLLVKLFTLAKAKKSAIIFLNKVDSLCRAAVTTQMIRTEFLDQMQKFIAADRDGITVVGATSAPWNLDAATRKCFEKQVYIPLPDIDARTRIFEICVGSTPTFMKDYDYCTLSLKTEGYSGKSINLVVKDALMMPLRKVQSATHFKKVRGPSPTDPQCIVNDLLTPCGPRDPGAIQMSWTEVQGDKLLEPKLSISDILRSLQMVSCPTISASDLKLFEEFRVKYGHGQST